MSPHDTFEHSGRTFAVCIESDNDADPPWDREDGHGPVSKWTTRDKQPGERILCCDGRHRRYYDVAGAIRLAKADAWGLDPLSQARLGRKPTRKQVVAEAVRLDYERLRGWCENEWQYVGVVVWLDGDPQDYQHALWGIESDAGEYLQDVARELADEINHEMDAEAAEAAHWAAADLATLED